MISVPPVPKPGEEQRPSRIVAIGGGTGLPVVLRGLRFLANQADMESIHAIVTMTDDGGSSGRLRRSLGIPPPGDVRNCLVALAEDEDLLAGIFQYRYHGSREFRGHSVGNLILAALAEQTGSFLKAVELSSRVLRIIGEILPATEDDVRLAAELNDGSVVVGESKIASSGCRIRRVHLLPEDAAPTEGVLEAILGADLVILGPGSLYTSLIPNIIVSGVADALSNTAAPVIKVANLASEQGETSELDLADQIAVIENHAAGPIVDAVLANDQRVNAEVARRYRAEGAVPLVWPNREYRDLPVFRRNLLAPGSKLRHDPLKTIRGVIEVWDAVRSRAAIGAAE